MASGRLLRVDDLQVEFRQGFRQPPLRAVKGVTFDVGAQQTVGLVGESGSGKSTICRAILGLVPVAGGTIRFDDKEITHATGKQRRGLSESLSVVFQDPYSSLNPTRTVRQALSEPLLVHRKFDRAAVDRKVAEALDRVGLGEDAAARYPRHFSGGQRQRIAIARALMLQPKLVICDEAVSALDLSIQAQVLNLLKDLQSELGLSYLFIAHDLAVVRFISQRIVVIYHGEVMESGPATEVYARPKHPYTRALLDSAPVADPTIQQQRRAKRVVHNASKLSSTGADQGCPFAPRCPIAIELCVKVKPIPQTLPDGSTIVCHRYSETAADRETVAHADAATTTETASA